MIICIIMILSLVFAAIFAFSAIEKSKSKVYNFLSVVLLFVCIGSIVFAYYPNKKELRYEFSYNIYALEDNMVIKGRRYYFEEDLRYYHLAEYKDGKKIYSVSKNESYIVEQDGATPHIEAYQEYYKNKLVNFLKGNTKFSTTLMLSPEYKIIVPKETLTKEFNVDVK